jgi:hypothetical protein
MLAWGGTGKIRKPTNFARCPLLKERYEDGVSSYLNSGVSNSFEVD